MLGIWARKGILVPLLIFVVLMLSCLQASAATPGDVVINEVAWMGTTDSSSDEWIELLNTTFLDIDIGLWSIFGADTGVCLNFADADTIVSSIIPANGYLIYGNDTATVHNGLAVSIVDIADATIGLNNTSPGQIILYDGSNCTGNIIDTANQAAGNWFAGVSATRISMERIDSAVAGDLSSNWADNNGVIVNGLDAGSNTITGTPGSLNSVSVQPFLSTFAGDVVINEVLFRQTGAGVSGNDEFIEIFNASGATMDISGWALIDGNLIFPDTEGIGSINGGAGPFIFPGGTFLAPDEYAVIWVGADSGINPAHSAPGAAFQAWLGQVPKLNNDGDDVWLYDSTLGIVDYMAYGSLNAINIPPPVVLGLWDTTFEAALGAAIAGQSLSLTSNGTNPNTSACWEPTASGNALAQGCGGFVPTIEPDTGLGRSSSSGINNNIFTPAAIAPIGPVVGGDPPIWNGIMVFPTPEVFEGRDLNGDGDLNDAVLRYQDLSTGQVHNTQISVSQNHRDIDIYGDNIVFVARNDSLLSRIRSMFNPSGQIGIYNIKTKKSVMLEVWGDRPTIFENILSISGSSIRYYDLNQNKLVNVGISGKNQAIWGDYIAFSSTPRGSTESWISLYQISTGVVIETKGQGDYPAIHENIVVFEQDQSLFYYEIDVDRVIDTGVSGIDAAIYGDHIVYSSDHKIFYYNIEDGHSYSTGKSGLEPDIFENVITYYEWEDWRGTDINLDGDRRDPILGTHLISDRDVALRERAQGLEPEREVMDIQVRQNSHAIRFDALDLGNRSAQIVIFGQNGRRIYSSKMKPGSALSWNMRTERGAPVANGVYLYRIIFWDAAGKITHTEIRKLFVMR